MQVSRSLIFFSSLINISINININVGGFTFLPSTPRRTPTTMQWEPLPQRKFSNRGRPRRFPLAAPTAAEEGKDPIAKKKTASKAANHGDVQTQEEGTRVPAWLRDYTPGLNSYLKVELDDVTLDRLHGLTQKVRARVDLTRTVEDKNYAGGDEVGNNDYQSRKKNTKGRPFKVKPRSRHSLHMTFFFAGEVPCELPPDELRDWHSELAECFRESGLYPASQFPETKPKKTAAGNDNDFSFQLVGLSLFPPKRKNLIVAILEASPPWHELHNKVMKIAKQSTSEGIREITKRKGKPKWTAHITLANIVGGTKEDSRELSSYLENFSQEELNNEKDILLTTRCISMGGPVPDQLDLDWTFHFPADEQS